MALFSKIKNTWRRKLKRRGGSQGRGVSLVLDLLPASLTRSNFDLWARAYEIVQQREEELMVDYMKHLASRQDGATTSGDLSSPRSVEFIVKVLLEDREKKKLQVSLLGHDIKVREQVEKLAKFLLWSDPFVKAAVNAQPYAALAWSGVSLLLPLLTSGTTQNESMLKGFNSLGDLQIYWQICEKTYLQSSHRQHYDGLIEPLANLYSFIIEYQARVICHLSKAQLSRAWQNLTGSNSWAGKIETITKLDEDCRSRFIPVGEQEEIRQNRDSQLKEMQRSRIVQEETLQTMKEHKQDKKERRLLQDLARAAGDYERYKNINPERVPGTCEWFLTDERFCNWRDRKSSSLLWVSAGPGRGKSVLARSVFDERQLTTTTITIAPSGISPSTTTPAICYFFFKDGGDGPMDGAQALCAILHQLFRGPSTSSLIKHALESHKSNGTTLTGKFHELWKILIGIASSTSTEIVCILDALDECKEDSRREIINSLRGYYSRSGRLSSGSKLKFLITSRPYDDIESSFQGFPETAAYLRFDGDDKSEQISQEIDLVIDARVPRIMGSFTEDDRFKISQRLKSMENRTYLWLHLTFDIIQRRRSAYGKLANIESLLSELPSEISDAYDKILSRSQDDRQTEILLQIVLVATRPLTLDEVNLALTLALQESRFSSYTEVKGGLWPSDNFKSVLQNLCGLFISVHDSKLSFIHQTAREFLTHPVPQGKWKGRFNMPKSHSTLSRVCHQYLLLPDLAIQAHEKSRVQQKPFLRYAASSWYFHFRSQDADSANKYRRDARELCRVPGPGAQLWMSSHDYSWRWLVWEFDPDLILASYLGLAPVVSELLTNENIAVNAVGRPYQTALNTAISQCYPEVVEVLLEPCHRVNITRREIESAVRNQQSEAAIVVSMLLDKRGSEIEVTEALLTAVTANVANRVAIMAVLLEKRGEIKVTEKLLCHAAELKEPALMALLLEKRGNEIKITEGVLEAAVSNLCNWEAMMILLLDKCDDKVEIIERVLKAAAWNSNGATIMTWLLDKWGNKVEITEGMLEAAAGNLSTGKAIMTLLLDRCGDKVEVIERVLKIAAWNSNGAIILTWLLDKWGDRVEVTEGVLEAAAGNWGTGKPILTLLLDKREDKITITEKVLEATARNSNGATIMTWLLDKWGDKVKITEKVLQAAARNLDGGVVMTLLLDKRGDKIKITEKVLEATVDGESRMHILALLLGERRDEVDILLRHSRNSQLTDLANWMVGESRYPESQVEKGWWRTKEGRA